MWLLESAAQGVPLPPTMSLEELSKYTGYAPPLSPQPWDSTGCAHTG